MKKKVSLLLYFNWDPELHASIFHERGAISRGKGYSGIFISEYSWIKNCIIIIFCAEYWADKKKSKQAAGKINAKRSTWNIWRNVFRSSLSLVSKRQSAPRHKTKFFFSSSVLIHSFFLLRLMFAVFLSIYPCIICTEFNFTSQLRIIFMWKACKRKQKKMKNPLLDEL